ncbi:MAG: putative modified peptide [Lysobacteraceae bacterium]|nr:MAG: putative modified peptide [Xanthomonadaceae bacterium]
MSNDLVLQKETALVLLRKLADDDAFRSAYERNPVEALRTVGVPDAVLQGLPAGHASPLKLAPKETFRDALSQLIDDAAQVCICQTPPQVSLSFGGRPAKASFEAR